MRWPWRILRDKTTTLVVLAILGICAYKRFDLTIASTFGQKDTTKSESTACVKKLNFFFLKLPKCGSGTTMNILQRFVLSHSLNPVLNMNFRSDHFYSRYIDPDTIIQKRDNETYNAFYLHAKYLQNKDLMEQLLPTDTYYFSIVREPAQRLASHLLYSNWYERARRKLSVNKTDEEVLLHVIGWKGGKAIETNKMVHYHGFQQEDPNEGLDEFIEKTFERFQFVMITEYFDESLVLLKRYMCWDLKEILYAQKAHEQDYTLRGANMSNPKIADWVATKNNADFVFYHRCLLEFHRRVFDEGPSFQEEVKTFKRMVESVSSFCFDGDSLEERLNIPESEWTPGFAIHRADCELYLMAPGDLIGYTRNYMLDKLRGYV